VTQTRNFARRLGAATVGSIVLTTSALGATLAQDASPSVAPSITPPPSVAPAQPPAIDKPDLPAPEQTAISIGYRLPNLNSRAPFLVALDRGYFSDAGFTDVQLVQTEETAPGLIGGSLQFGNVETLDTANGFAEGLPLQALAGYQNYTANMIAVRPEIATPADLAGKDILLGGTPGSLDFDLRANMLAEAGFDITGVPFNAVNVDGGSNAWVALFLEDKLAMTPIFNRHRQQVLDAGGRLVVDRFDYGSDMLATNRDWAAANPNTVRAFLSAYIRALADVQDPANTDYVMSLGERAGITITDGVRAGWDGDHGDRAYYEAFDGGFGDVTQGGGLGELEAYLGANLPEGVTVDLSQFVDSADLNAVQQALGLEANPAPAS
jgi:ABC-type nitrate/sulfonate/bicarbonate transport system substrate-binding protein